MLSQKYIFLVKNLDQPELVPLSAAIDVENVARIVGNVDNNELPAGASFPVLPMSEKNATFCHNLLPCSLTDGKARIFFHLLWTRSSIVSISQCPIKFPTPCTQDGKQHSKRAESQVLLLY